MARILDNIRVFAEKEGITLGALERKIGASKGVLSRAIANGTDIQAKWITAIIDNYPLVSAQWLLTGEGEMIMGDSCGEKVCPELSGDWPLTGTCEMIKNSNISVTMSPIVSRLIQYISYKGLSDKGVERDCNLPNVTLQQKRKKGGDFRSDTVLKILEAYPELNRDWLLTGEGEMLKTPECATNTPERAVDRLLAYIARKNITANIVCSTCGISPSTITKAKQGRNDLGRSTVNSIVEHYPDLNPDWLNTGRGEMLKTPECATNNITRARNDELPLHEHIEALAGIPSEDAAPSQYYSSYIVPDFKRQGATDLIRIHGNSMLPRYNSGDIVGVMQIFDPQFIEWGRVYVLDTTQGVLIKRLFPDKQNADNYLCHSDNTEEYPDFSIPKTEIRKIFKVVGSIKLE